MAPNYWGGIFHVTRREELDRIGLPAVSIAGEYRPRRVIAAQAARSSADDPLDDVTRQFSTRPWVLISQAIPTVPSSSARSELGG